MVIKTITALWTSYRLTIKKITTTEIKNIRSVYNTNLHSVVLAPLELIYSLIFCASMINPILVSYRCFYITVMNISSSYSSLQSQQKTWQFQMGFWKGAIVINTQVVSILMGFDGPNIYRLYKFNLLLRKKPHLFYIFSQMCSDGSCCLPLFCSKWYFVRATLEIYSVYKHGTSILCHAHKTLQFLLTFQLKKMRRRSVKHNLKSVSRSFLLGILWWKKDQWVKKLYKALAYRRMQIWCCLADWVGVGWRQFDVHVFRKDKCTHDGMSKAAKFSQLMKQFWCLWLYNLLSTGREGDYCNMRIMEERWNAKTSSCFSECTLSQNHKCVRCDEKLQRELHCWTMTVSLRGGGDGDDEGGGL